MRDDRSRPNKLDAEHDTNSTRRSFLVAAAGAAAVYGIYHLFHQKEQAHVPKLITTFRFGVPWENAGYSQGYRIGGTAYISGQFSHDQSGHLVYANDISGQTRQTLDNLDRVLEGLGLARTNLAMVKLLLVNLRDNHQAVSSIFKDYHAGRRPAVTLYGVTGLAFPHQLIEISAIAHE